MKFPTLLLTSLLLLGGCSHQNGFTKFQLPQDEEAAMASLQSSKIRFNDEVAGVISAVYLNDVYPSTYNTKEYFLISLYLKESQKSEDTFQIKLNADDPLELKPLSHTDKLSHLSGTQSPWSSYYIVVFQEQSKNTLELLLQEKQYSSQNIVFRKNEE